MCGPFLIFARYVSIVVWANFHENKVSIIWLLDRNQHKNFFGCTARSTIVTCSISIIQNLGQGWQSTDNLET
jgi:hypothetical protein